MDAKKRPKHVE